MRIVTTYQDKKVYFLTGEVSQVSSEDFELPEPHFICTFFFHDTNWNQNDLVRLLHRLIKNGCVYFLFHGHGCKEAHDLADASRDELCSSEITDENVIMTTWHEKEESLEDVIFDTFIASHPTEDYLESCTSYIIFSFGSSEENAHVEHLLGNLEATIKQVSDEG